MGGFWFAAVDRQYWPKDPEQLAMLTRDFEGDVLMDRRQVRERDAHGSRPVGGSRPRPIVAWPPRRASARTYARPAALSLSISFSLSQCLSGVRLTLPAVLSRFAPGAPQEMVFIGQNLERNAISAALDACLLTEAEAKHPRGGGASEHGWKLDADNLDDRFPRWM